MLKHPRCPTKWLSDSNSILRSLSYQNTATRYHGRTQLSKMGGTSFSSHLELVPSAVLILGAEISLSLDGRWGKRVFCHPVVLTCSCTALGSCVLRFKTPFLVRFLQYLIKSGVILGQDPMETTRLMHRETINRIRPIIKLSRDFKLARVHPSSMLFWANTV